MYPFTKIEREHTSTAQAPQVHLFEFPSSRQLLHHRRQLPRDKHSHETSPDHGLPFVVVRRRDLHRLVRDQSAQASDLEHALVGVYGERHATVTRNGEAAGISQETYRVTISRAFSVLVIAPCFPRIRCAAYGPFQDKNGSPDCLTDETLAAGFSVTINRQK